ncbi:MAG: flagellar biosynthesis protein FlgH [Deltaproteobacteria bacterium HGW-Deltaproteobacteria-15]|nr:MAG: flagellar biosynthesis protein FlgH [Deltaproteobacteria bacterium HGW-Deltaproteobacteria-15]
MRRRERMRRVVSKARKWLGLMIVLSAVSGCGTIPSLTSDRNVRNMPEIPREVSIPVKEIPSDGSLWRGNGQKSLFRDLRAREVGDLVTVNIAESSKASKKANTKTSRESSIEAGINNVLGWEGKIKEIASLGNKNVRAAVDANNLFKASLENEHEGKGETNRDESMTASITARVTSVTPDGNLYITGTREVRVNNETQYITLTGLIRPEDISPDNTVLSSYIADAKIAYSGSGPVSDKQRPGWLTRLVDFAWPF